MTTGNNFLGKPPYQLQDQTGNKIYEVYCSVSEIEIGGSFQFRKKFYILVTFGHQIF